jgi:hypothetical protein
MEELKKFTGQSMNLDKNDKTLLPTETREVYNSITDRKGVFTRFEGNTLVNFTLPAGDNEVVGSVNDYSRSAIIYFVKNSLGNHCILRVRGRMIDAVLFAQPVLNFKGRITHANTIGDLLYWTDGFFESYSNANPPRKINMVRAIGSLNPYTAQVYQKFDVVNSDGKVYEFIGETPGVFPLTDRDNWAVKGRIYDNLTTDRLYWILDRIKYPRSAEAPVVYYSDNVPAVDPPVIIDPPTLIPYGYLYNWDALFDVVPDPPADALELTFDDIANVPVADAESVSDWNTFFDLPTNGSPFTSVVVDANKVSLFGGSGITLKDNLFYFPTFGDSDHLLKIVDVAECITEAGDFCFYNNAFLNEVSFPVMTTAGESTFHLIYGFDCSFNLPELVTAGESCFSECNNTTEITLPKLESAGVSCFAYTGCDTVSGCTFDLPLLETIGDSCFADCVNMTINIPSCTSLGSSVGDNTVFYYMQYTTVSVNLTIPAALMTCNGGNPDGDIQWIQDPGNGVTVTIVTV